VALGIGVYDGEEARAVEVDVGIEVTTVEVVEFGREALGDVFIAEVFADNGAIFTLGQGRCRWRGVGVIWAVR
jgi:hypothetical protein